MCKQAGRVFLHLSQQSIQYIYKLGKCMQNIILQPFHKLPSKPFHKLPSKPFYIFKKILFQYLWVIDVFPQLFTLHYMSVVHFILDSFLINCAFMLSFATLISWMIWSSYLLNLIKQHMIIMFVLLYILDLWKEIYLLFHFIKH